MSAERDTRALLHRTTNRRYALVCIRAGVAVLQPIDGPQLLRPAAELNNPEIWRRV